MKDKRFGIVILVSGLLCFAIFSVLCSVVFYLDQLSGSYFNNFLRYIPRLGFGSIVIVLIVGFYYTFKENFDQ